MAKKTKGPPIEVRASPIAGLGVFATRAIRRGDRIIEYVGEHVSAEEAGRRYDDDTMEQHHTFLFALDDDTVIDAAVGGNEARFVNHACDPNCQAVNEEGRIFIEALRDIEPGTELLYDYALMREDRWKASWATLYACRCGAPKCKGTMLKRPRPPRPRKAQGSRDQADRAATRSRTKATKRTTKRSASKAP